jgi:predicted small integral membrane protein
MMDQTHSTRLPLTQLTSILALRTTKILALATTAVIHALITLNNIFDFQSNYVFTQHVLSMDTTFQPGSLGWRAITTPGVQRLFYFVIIAWEALIAIFCAIGTVRCATRIKLGIVEFNEAKNWAFVGLALGIGLWMFAFLTIAGEWFVMWQSTAWNGQSAALRMFVLIAVTLILLAQSERDYE